ncbi:hypothetical protein L903_18805 [Agrobacterium sp. JL28]|nr:hypothetical protein L902_01995 [Agrobacterium radiobacter DSM 30147]KVK49925.1 hypothetical protein L903_18805 [Agrobacterium sp. JL28]KVK50217.1 hypothetical protein L904_18805 [Agrobacterium sp. LY4]
MLEQAFRRPSRSDIDVASHLDSPNLPDITVHETNDAEATAKRDEFLKRWHSYAEAAQ